MTSTPDAAYPVRPEPIRNTGGLILGAPASSSPESSATNGDVSDNGRKPFTIKTNATIPTDGNFSAPGTATWKIIVNRARAEVAALDREHVFHVE